MEFVKFLEPEYVTTFLLLLIRFNALIAFLPFFSYQSIPLSLKGAFAFVLAVVMFPFTPLVTFEPNSWNIMLAILNEGVFGVFAGIIISLSFMVLQFAGQLVSFVMGMTMASIVDPQTGMQVPVIGQFFNLVALLVFLAIDGHHIMLMMMANSITSMPFGEFFDMTSTYKYLSSQLTNFFVLGLSIAFPILSISILSDIIFGMIMKTIPQFNLLVVGFPIKIGLSFMVIIAILSSMMFLFKRDVLNQISAVNKIIGGG